MKQVKQKHWQVSVFDKTSETVRDDTFYTTDTEAYLVFELIDEDFKPDSAMVTVYNIYGTAIINVSVEVADGIARYEMPEKAIRHRGGWRTQVIFTKDNEDYTTRVIEFDVGGHLLDSKKPPIVEIENWNSFIAHAGELIDNWEQLEEIRQTNETSRQVNELAREEAEGNRQSEFEENELARKSAESVRVANEEERISKDSERDSKIEVVEGRQDSVESQWQAVSDEMTDKDVISAPEIIAARDGEANLKARLDKENQEVTAQLAENATLISRSYERNEGNYIVPTAKPTKAYITFVDDDGSKDVLTKLLPVFSSRNIPCVVAVNVNNNDIYSFDAMTIEEIKDLQDNYGWEVANHGYNHVNFTTVIGEDLHHEIADCYKHYSAKGIKINSLVYPFGIINDEGRQIAKKYHQFGVTAGGGIVPKPLSTFSIPRIPFGSMTETSPNTYEFYKSKVDEAIADNKWLIFMTHVWHESHNSTQQQHLEDILDYCLSNDVEIVTLSEGYKVFGNREEVVGKYVITNNEEKIELTPNTDYKIISDNTIKSDTPISDFKKYTKTITQVHQSRGNTSGFPTSDGAGALGLLETFVVGFGGGDTYSHQLYYEYRHNIVWYRKVSSDGAWNNWEKLNTKAPITAISESVTIPANGFEIVRIPVSNLQGLDLIGKSFSVVPISNFDSRVVYSYRYVNPNLDIILFNPTTNSKTLTNINWRIKLLE